MLQTTKEISLRDIFTVAIRRWRIILGATACAFVGACAYALLATPYYTATVVVQPKTRTSIGGSLGQLVGQFGALSSLAGLNLSAASSRENNYLAVLGSRELALKFIDQFRVMPALFPKRWNPVLRRWHDDNASMLSRIKLTISREVARLSGDQGWHPSRPRPSASQALKSLRRVLTIDHQRDTGMVSVSFTVHNPKEAAEWANEYVNLANDQIRDRVIGQANLALKYLDEQVENTKISELKVVIYNLVQQRLEEIVSAKSQPDYAFQIIDAAMVPRNRSSPKRLLIIIVVTLIGGAGGLMYVLVQEFSGPSAQSSREK